MGVCVWITKLIGHSIQEEITALSVELHNQCLEDVQSSAYQKDSQ